MVTVIQRPLGHKLTDEDVEGVIGDSGAGVAQITTLFAHGLADGDYIFIQSDIEEYNGYKYVDSQAYDTFRIRESEDGDYVPYVQDAEISYRVSVLQHGYLAAAQPIVYELESDLWPLNLPEDTYTPRVVSSQADAEGYTKLNLSAPLNGPLYLDFIELVGDGPLAGTYQILEVLQPWEVVINLTYSASNSFEGYTVVKYYNNYCINVGIYCGLSVDHPWYERKPYEQAAILRLTPGDDNRVKFSISDIVRGYLTTRNNLTLGSLPNNLDFFTGFYIEYWESYDASNGDEIITLESAPTSDKENFEGKAINADMPFKSLYISHMSEYIHEDVYLAKWLVLQRRPIAIVGKFFEISFINSLPRVDILINVNKSSSGQIVAAYGFDYPIDFAFDAGEVDETLTITIPNPGIGVIRVPLEIEAGYNEYCVYAYTNGVDASASVPATSLAALSAWVNVPGAGWSLGANPTISVNGNGGVSGYIKGAIVTAAGYDYEFTVEFEIGVTGSSTPTSAVVFALLDASNNNIDTVGFNYTTAGVKTETFTLSSIVDGAALSMFVTNNTPFDTKNYDIQSAVYNSPGAPPDDSIPAQTITETICIEVLEECDNTFIPDDIRLTEDGDYRILE